MDDTCHIKYIDHFYQLVIKSALSYLTGVYGQEDMTKNPGDILEDKKTHLGERVPGRCAMLGINLCPFLLRLRRLKLGTCIRVKLLHELLLPWFAVRNAIRCNAHKTLDWSWSYFLPLFRATNKHQYACEFYECVLCVLSPPAQARQAPSRVTAGDGSQPPAGPAPASQGQPQPAASQAGPLPPGKAQPGTRKKQAVAKSQSHMTGKSLVAPLG